MTEVYRSFLFAPGNNTRLVGKCVTAGADAVILDLEDAVPRSEKTAARQVVVAALAQPRQCKGYVRVNGLATQWCYGDLVAVVAHGVDGIVLPKVESAQDLSTVNWLVRSLERDAGLPLGLIDVMPIVETGAGVANLPEIARAGRGAGVSRLALGAGDLTVDLAMVWTDDETELQQFRISMVVESRAAGLEPPIDTGLAKLGDPALFARSAHRAKDLGFQGKLCIHPTQVDIANDLFRPSAAEVAQARKIVAAFDSAEADGRAAIVVDGQFVDYPIAFQARRVLARAEKIDAAET